MAKIEFISLSSSAPPTKKRKKGIRVKNRCDLLLRNPQKGRATPFKSFELYFEKYQKLGDLKI